MAIETFIFFDVETTGLIEGKNMPRITEIALVAVARKSICNSNKNSLPRVLHKLVIPVNPQKIILPRVEFLTKLSNEDMQLLQPFNCNVYELIMHFLQRLTPPICFVAHNGDGFDYPIFLWELKCINKVLDNEILGIDTWKMFQDFFKKRNQESEVIQDMLNDEYDDALSKLDLDVTTKEIKDTVTTTTSQTIFIPDNRTCSKIINDEEYNTEEKHGDHIEEQSPKRQKYQNERTPKSQIIQQNVCPNRPMKKNPRKRLDFGFRQKPTSLKLGAIYEYMFDSNLPHEHSAEADCLAMIRCIVNIANFFLKWSDEYATPLIYCKKQK